MSLTLENICIKGSPEHGKRIIQFFERLGGNNPNGYDACGAGKFYFIHNSGEISLSYAKPEHRTEITLSDDSLLPSEWCVKSHCEEAIKYLNKKYGYGWKGDQTLFYGERNGGIDNGWNEWGLTLTPSQFKALTEDQREIEGYLCPMDFKAWGNAKGKIFKKEPFAALYEWEGYKMPAEIVETWQPVFKEEKIVVDEMPVGFDNGVARLSGHWFNYVELAAIHRILSSNTTPETIEKIINRLK